MKLTQEMIFFVLTWPEEHSALDFLENALNSSLDDYEITKLDDVEKNRILKILKMKDTDVKFVDYRMASAVKNLD